MVDAIRQINHELQNLTQAIATLATELDVLYENYLAALRTSIQKQVVLACYHLCTHSYPDKFLNLSLREREALQQAIQSLVRQQQQRLMNAYVLATTPPSKSEDDPGKGRKRQRSLLQADRSLKRSRQNGQETDPETENDGPSIEFIAIGGDVDADDVLAIANDPSLVAALSEFADNLTLEREEIAEHIKRELLRRVSNAESSDDNEDDNHSDWLEENTDTELDSDEHFHQSGSPTVLSAALVFGDGMDNQNQDTGATDPVPEVPYTKFADGAVAPTPTTLVSRQQWLEKNVADVLRELSSQANYQLHQAGIIPKKLPVAVLDAALKSEVSAEPLVGSPNVLNLLVEVGGKSKNAKMMRVKALSLRASALEFSDPHLAACRSRLRELSNQLQKIGKTYEQKQRSLAIAEAEAAWRASWYDCED